MTEKEWKDFKYFSPLERWGNPKKIRYELVAKLEKLREFIKNPIVIHCGTQGKHVPGSYHYKGMAVDCHAEGISLIDFYLMAERFNFGGIGIYSWWHPSGGLHLDIRDTEYGARWASDKEGRYIALDESFFKKILCKGLN